MYEDHGPILWQYNVGGPRKILSMKSESKAERVKSGPDDYFRFGILAAYCGHIPASLLGRVDIRHTLLAASREV